MKRLEREVVLAGLSPDAIELEFTESALMKNESRVLDRLQQIRALGFEIAIDDFGSGYSNLGYLQKLPAHAVKIDQSLVREIATSRRDHTIAGAMIGMLRDLGFSVVAEGIESQEVYDQLLAWGCNEAQGYFISRPLEREAVPGWVMARSGGSEDGDALPEAGAAAAG